MSENKLFKTALAGTLAVSCFFQAIEVQAKPVENKIALEQSQKEPTLKEDAQRYGKKIKGFFTERWQDRQRNESFKCKRNSSTTQRCQNLRKKYPN